MPKRKQVEIITEAKPHTIKKFEIIENYVELWARKVLSNPKMKGIIYIDCMCNSGHYKDINGNLIEGTALRVARLLNNIITDYPGKRAILLFNDLEEVRVEHLKQEIEKCNLNKITLTYRNMDCDDFLFSLKALRRDVSFNTLLLYDPYKASINWDAISPFLNRWGDVIINHMSSDTKRGASQAKNIDVIGRYESTYQSDIEALIGASQDDLDKIIISLIRNNIENPKREYYVSPAPFYSRTNGKIYSLILCSGNIKGITTFKKVIWKTFGDRSSLKKTKGRENQLMFDIYGAGGIASKTDTECYFVSDIAKYIFGKFSKYGEVDLNEIYKDLDKHPIFPSDGYKNDIKNELKTIYGVSIKNGKVVFPKGGL